MYSKGAKAEFEDLLVGLYPSRYNFTTVEAVAQSFSAKQAAYKQDYIDYSSAAYNYFQIEANSTSSTYGEPFAYKRRQTLFNLYAFTYTDTFQKNISAITRNASMNDDYKIPTLELDNVEVKNFLVDYQALIYVEKDNYIHR